MQSTYLVWSDHKGSSNITAILLVFDSHTGQDDIRFQVVLIRFGTDLEVVFPSGLDNRCIDPVRRLEIHIGELLVLVPELHVRTRVVVSEFGFAQAIKRISLSCWRSRCLPSYPV